MVSSNPMEASRNNMTRETALCGHPRYPKILRDAPRASTSERLLLYVGEIRSIPAAARRYSSLCAGGGAFFSPRNSCRAGSRFFVKFAVDVFIPLPHRRSQGSPPGGRFFFALQTRRRSAAQDSTRRGSPTRPRSSAGRCPVGLCVCIAKFCWPVS